MPTHTPPLILTPSHYAHLAGALHEYTVRLSVRANKGESWTTWKSCADVLRNEVEPLWAALRAAEPRCDTCGRPLGSSSSSAADGETRCTRCVRKAEEVAR